ncbi:MAG: phosphatase PAP2 family protein [Pseudobacteriovorax sp.]|nr:phosphatase PAP2 family protein [Pseudobacteriovorax sp.]
MEFLHSLDEKLFFYVNHGLSNRILDVVMVAISSHWIWLIVLALVGLQIDFKKRGWKIILIAGVAVGLSDLFAFEVLKPYFGRMRPCKVLEGVNIVKSCGGRFGFPSNHAINSATFAVSMMLWRPHRFMRFLLAFAILVGFSRVYLGVHYPGDVLFGFSLGVIWAFTFFKVCRSFAWSHSLLPKKRNDPIAS